MTQEEKQLLLVDLSARLPYGVKVQTTFINQKTKKRSDIGIDILTTTEISLLIDGFEEHKPFLYPMSSMTKEQKIMIRALQDMGLLYYHLIIEHYNEWHIDYRGLIGKGLANDATGLNIY